MGMYVNPDNERLRDIVAGEYVAKTGLIALANDVIGTLRKLLCVTRPPALRQDLRGRVARGLLQLRRGLAESL